VPDSLPEESELDLASERDSDALVRLLSPVRDVPAREGLPPTYRMRADRHYVEMLDAPRPTPAVEAPSGQAPLPVAAPATTTAGPAFAIDAELGNILSVVASCVNLFGHGSWGIAQSVSLDLMKAEIGRGSSLLRAAQVLREDAKMTWTRVAVGGLFERVLEETEAECRLRDMRPTTQIEGPPDLTIKADVDELVLALSVLLRATLTMVAGAPAIRVACVTTATAEGGVRFTVEQHTVVPPAQWVERAFDASWTDRPGGEAERVSLLAAARIAHRHDGSTGAVRLPRGAALSLTLPTQGAIV
jgi:hypothetical protein